MKMTPKFPVAFLFLTTLLLSWNRSNNVKQRHFSSSSYSSDQVTDDEWVTFIDDNDEQDQLQRNQFPAAEDVLVQKIPGDNRHLLIMAFYSKENYSGELLTLEDGSGIVLRDDGKEFDKTAGDGLYTARINADVKEFRKQAAGIADKMKKNNYKPSRYDHRALVYDPDASEDFDVANFEANEPVSISGVTNSLSSDFSTLATGTTTLDLIRQNSVVITNLRVVEDSTRTWNSCSQRGNVNGPWTFGTLMRQLASKDPSNIASDAAVSGFVKNWLNTWAKSRVINGDTVKARTLVSNILNPWLSQSKSAGAPTGQLDMRFAPFKLIAIVNRFDLRDGALNGIPGSPCGEGRFVFCLIKSDCSRALQMTVIFEYGINKAATCSEQKAWAQQWVNLKNFAIGSSGYNSALQKITDQFTLCGSNPSRPNQSSLNHVRTNEVTLSPNPKIWEFREFFLNSKGILRQKPLEQTPADKYNAKTINDDVKLMVDYVTKNQTSIVSETNVVPLKWNGVPFLAGSSHILDSPTGTPPKVYHWDGTNSSSASTFIRSNNARFFFSFNTCSGCHGGETQTHFTHVDPVFFGTEATLSGFLTGKAGNFAIDFDRKAGNDTMAVKDAALRPSSDPKIRNFNDIKRRAQDLKKVVSTTCGSVLSISSQLMFQPLNSPD